MGGFSGMAKKNFTLSFKNCYIDVEDNKLIEVQKDYTMEYDLDKILKEVEGKQLNISFVESRDFNPSELE